MSTKILQEIEKIQTLIEEIQQQKDEYYLQMNAKLEYLGQRTHRYAVKVNTPAILHDLKDSVEAAKEANQKAGQPGKIRVGRIAGMHEKGKKYPITYGYLNVVVTSHNTRGLGAQLSPYVLKDKQGRLMENTWQFAKFYDEVPLIPIKSESRDGWTYPATIFTEDEDIILGEYWKWRAQGMMHPKPVRYPVGFADRHNCRFAIWPKNLDISKIDKVTTAELCKPDMDYDELDYLAARRAIYCPLYIHLARQTDDYKTLQKMLQEGYNLQILDVDGPRRDRLPASLEMPEGVYGEDKVGSIEINEKNIKALLDYTGSPFGHGFTLAADLLGISL